MIPGPSTGYEVFVPGRQGKRACRASNPACGSADLLGTPSAVSSLSRSFPWCRGEAACAVHQPGRPERQNTSKGQNAGPVWCSASSGMPCLWLGEDLLVQLVEELNLAHLGLNDLLTVPV